MMRLTIDISEARKELNKIDKRLANEQVIYITRHGRLAFAVVSIDFIQSVEETLEILGDPKAAAMLIKALGDIREGRLHTHDEVRRAMT